jgi:hypothetical protein
MFEQSVFRRGMSRIIKGILSIITSHWCLTVIFPQQGGSSNIICDTDMAFKILRDCVGTPSWKFCPLILVDGVLLVLEKVLWEVLESQSLP